MSLLTFLLKHIMCFKEHSCLCFWKTKVFLFSPLLPSLNLFLSLKYSYLPIGTSLNLTSFFCLLNLSLAFMVSFITSTYMGGHSNLGLKFESKLYHLLALWLWEITQFMHVKMALSYLAQKVGRIKWDKVCTSKCLAIEIPSFLFWWNVHP